MNTLVALVLLGLASYGYAVDMTFSPNLYTTSSNIVIGQQLLITNTAGSSLTSISFTVAPNSTGVAIAYPGGATKCTVGTISNGNTGGCSFSTTAPTGSYSLTFTISYKKGLSSLSTTYTAPLTASDGSGSGKRLELDAEDIERDSDNDEDDVAVVPSTIRVVSGEQTWVPISITNTAGSKLRDVSYFPSFGNNNFQVSYGSACGGANYLGDLSKNAVASASYAIQANLASRSAPYNLNIRVHYRRGSKWYDYIQAVNVYVDASASRSKIVDFATNEDGSIRGEYIVGAGVGVGLFAGLAVVGAAVVYRKRTATIAA